MDEEERTALEVIADRGASAGVRSLVILDQAEIRRREPLVHSVAALWSPESGIVDAHALMESYRRELRHHGGDLVVQTEVVSFDSDNGGSVRVVTRSSDGEEFVLRVDHVVNAAGLWADRVAAMAGLELDRADGPSMTLHWCKGDYFSLSSGATATEHRASLSGSPASGTRPFISPPISAVDASPDRMPPTWRPKRTTWNRAKRFSSPFQSPGIFPTCVPKHLSPDYSGIRPKLQGPSEAFRDFFCEQDGPFRAPHRHRVAGAHRRRSPREKGAGAA